MADLLSIVQRCMCALISHSFVVGVIREAVDEPSRTRTSCLILQTTRSLDASARGPQSRVWLGVSSNLVSYHRYPLVPLSFDLWETITMLGLRIFGGGIRSFSTTAVAQFPKLKTHQGAKKRWRAIANGKFKRVCSTSWYIRDEQTNQD